MWGVKHIMAKYDAVSSAIRLYLSNMETWDESEGMLSSSKEVVHPLCETYQTNDVILGTDIQMNNFRQLSTMISNQYAGDL